MITLKDLAIKKALENNWKEAVVLNQKILDVNPNEIDTLNRLAFALIKIGKFKKAKDMYKQVMKIDKTNPIATKNLKKIDSISGQSSSDKVTRDTNDEDSIFLQDIFIEEAGKTKIIDLKNLADRKTLSLLQAGDPVSIIIKRSKIFIQTHNKYVGMLPDSIGVRLIPFIKGGNQYRAFIRSVNDKCVCVFLKEVHKASKFKNQISFNTTSFSYSKD